MQKQSVTSNLKTIKRSEDQKNKWVLQLAPSSLTAPENDVGLNHVHMTKEAGGARASMVMRDHLD